MKNPIASIFIAIFAVATGVSAQDAKGILSSKPPVQDSKSAAAPAKPPLPAVAPPPLAPRPVAAPLQGGLTPASTTMGQRTAHDATIPPTASEQERLDRLGGQPLLWLKTMAAHETARKTQTTAPDKGVPSATNKVVKRKKPPKKTQVKPR